MLNIQNLSFHFGSRTIFEEASLHIKPKNRIGIIGQNGRGKTTLLKLINGDLTPDGGEIQKAKEVSIGFLNQDLLSYESDEPILNVAMQGFKRELELQTRIDEILKQMETNYTDKLLNQLAQLQDEFTTLGGYSIQSKAEEILEGLGFLTEDLSRPLREFSGGWRMRVMLAKLLLQNPSVLMLDEPTNHLDLPSIEWLENYITTYEGAILIVSHDQEFLNRAVNSIVEVSGGALNFYPGNYDFFLEEKEMRDEIQRNAFKNQQQKIKQTEQFINRFKAKATKARQVQSKVKMLEKMDKVDDIVDDTVVMDMDFRFSQQPGKIITELVDITKAYNENTIFNKASITIERGDKIALIGANGKGKSTLLRMVADSEDMDQGQRRPGYNVIPAFYAQHQLESLTIENEIIEELKQAGSGKTELQLRTLLGCFLFTSDEVFKKIKVLSGGEKSRVALAKTLISEANFLLLDEPTNHLDIQSVNILIQALQQYEGSYLIVSHDRRFISQVANKIWYIENQQVKVYPGTYDEFTRWKAERDAALAEETQELKQEAKPKKTSAQSNGQQEKKKATNHDEKQYKQAKKALDSLEEELDVLEKEKAALEEEMAKPSIFSDPYLLAEKTEAYEAVEKKITKLNEEWESLALAVESYE